MDYTINSYYVYVVGVDTKDLKRGLVVLSNLDAALEQIIQMLVFYFKHGFYLDQTIMIEMIKNNWSFKNYFSAQYTDQGKLLIPLLKCGGISKTIFLERHFVSKEAVSCETE